MVFIVYDEHGNFYKRACDEMEADYLAYCVNGFYEVQR